MPITRSAHTLRNLAPAVILVLLQLALAAAGSGCAAVYTAVVEKANPPTGTALQNGERTTYVYREGAGAPVVFVHGNPGDARDAQFLQHELAWRGFETISFDRPGHGNSAPATPASIDEQLSMLDAVVCGTGNDPVILVGHSWGGALSLLYARAHPERVGALVLVAPVIVPDRKLRELVPALYSAFIPRLVIANAGAPVAWSAAAWQLDSAWGPRAIPDDRDKWFRRASFMWARPRIIRAFDSDDTTVYKALTQAWNDQSDSSMLATVNRIPTIVLVGTKDAVVNPARHAQTLAARSPDIVLVSTMTNGHMLPMSDPEAVADAVVGAKRWVATGQRPGSDRTVNGEALTIATFWP